MISNLMKRVVLLNGVRHNTTDAAKTTSSSPTASAILPSNMSNIEQMYMKKLQEKNAERYAKERVLRRRYNITGVALSLFVFSVYFYTMFSIKQEKFLDDFEVPEPPDPAVKAMRNK
jgi:cytochrome c oxidase assembly factor 3